MISNAPWRRFCTDAPDSAYGACCYVWARHGLGRRRHPCQWRPAIVAYPANARLLPHSCMCVCARGLCQRGGNLIECGFFGGRLLPPVTQPLTADGRRSSSCRQG
uniref:Uncharacterized protein n=1 Tax=Plectus sambesii TaxID=2011161 RepID=A0A914UY20_9BILA